MGVRRDFGRGSYGLSRTGAGSSSERSTYGRNRSVSSISRSGVGRLTPVAPIRPVDPDLAFAVEPDRAVAVLEVRAVVDPVEPERAFAVEPELAFAVERAFAVGRALAVERAFAVVGAAPELMRASAARKRGNSPRR